MSSQSLGKPRPLWQVITLSLVTGLVYYGYYKWIIQDELRAYTGRGWSGALSLLPFLLGVTVPPALAWFDPDVPPWFSWFFLGGIVWIYIVQFRLYCTVNRLYQDLGHKPPLTVWWLFVPGLNVVVGLQQIHCLSQFWAMQRQTTIADPIAKALPALFAASLMLVLGVTVLPTPAQATPLVQAPVLAAGSLFSFAGDRPETLGIQTGGLAACPQSPNCVSTQSTDKQHRVEPLQYDGPLDAAIAQLKTIIEGLPRAEVLEVTDDYLYAEFTSSLMGFVDDVEFYLDPTEPVIQARSASRLGESDMGVNRKRIENIRKKLNGFSLPG